MSAELGTETRIFGDVMNELFSDASTQGTDCFAGDSNQYVPTTVANDFIPYGPADVTDNAVSFGPADMANDHDSQVKPENEFCEFQYIEIVPLGSPKQAENNNENCSSEVKEEVKQEPEDVWIVSLLPPLLPSHGFWALFGFQIFLI